MPPTISKDQRLALRLSRPQRAVIEEAALLRGESLTDFSVTAAVGRAEEVLAERRTWILSPEDWERFVAAIDHPARVLPGLADLARRPSLFE
ncbi:MAG: DUF1778 domain-containing protein [Bifidobacteriaceae bacterium]|nr:DUF1778 domain-containing protein [Bifidobacteriaceae bacterium]